MAGVLPGEGVAGHRLLRFGYVKLTAREDSLLFRKGEPVPAHEFHHWESTCCGTDLMASGNHDYSCGVTTPTLYAGFPHLCMAGDVPLAERFTEACRERRRRNGKTEPCAN
jgi:cobyrinic acid a,c-diamide synthase